MVRKIGLLPASGAASRLHGMPKFALPYDDTISLLQYHVNLMLEVVDEVRICTRESWLPLLAELDITQTAKISVMEPSTMNDALFKMIEPYTDAEANEYIIGMPDTVWVNSRVNPYGTLAAFGLNSHVTLLTSPFREALRGKVGQVEVDQNGNVLEIIDKDKNCQFTRIWTAFRMSPYLLNRNHSSPSNSFRELLQMNTVINSAHIDAEYHDLGTIEGLRMFYNSTGKLS